MSFASSLRSLPQEVPKHAKSFNINILQIVPRFIGFSFKLAIRLLTRKPRMIGKSDGGSAF